MTKKTISLILVFTMIMLLFIGCSDKAEITVVSDSDVTGTDTIATDTVVSEPEPVIVTFDTTTPLRKAMSLQTPSIRSLWML